MTSPASTGGSGALFEAQVGAAYLLSILREVDARGLPNCRIESIGLQRGQEGYPLDDVIIHGQDRSGKAATLEIQVGERAGSGSSRRQVVLLVSNADKFVAERLSCVLRPHALQ